MDQLTAARIQTVRDHMRLECGGDSDGVIATFAHPRYELYGAGTVFDREQAVRGYFAASRIPFPDQVNVIIAIGASGDSVLVEFWLTGTHLGPLRTPKARSRRPARRPRPHDGELRVRTRHGQHHLRAPVLRPPRGGHGAWTWLTEQAAYFRQTDPAYELFAIGDEQQSAAAVRVIQYGLRSRASTRKALTFSSLMYCAICCTKNVH